MIARDEPDRWPVLDRRPLMSGRVISVDAETVEAPHGERFVRDVVSHPGAVAIVALDDRQRVLLVHQYRHPVGHRLFELPAGLLDVAGEDPVDAARRELYEETHTEASDWRLVVDIFASPGMTTESVRVFLARGVRDSDGERHVGEAEEAHMPVHRVPLPEVVEGIVSGRLHNAVLVAGVLAVWTAAQGPGLDSLRPAATPWEAFVPPREAAVQPAPEGSAQS